MTKAELIKETIRIANRDHGIWVKADEVEFAANDAETWDAAEVAAELAKLIYAPSVVEALEALDRSLDEEVDTLNAVAQYETTNGVELEDSHPLIVAYHEAADQVETYEMIVIAAAGRRALELAKYRDATERALLLELFAPAFENKAEGYTAHQRVSLMAKARALAAF